MREDFSSHKFTDGSWLSIIRIISEEYVKKNKKGNFFSEFPDIWMTPKSNYTPLLGKLSTMVDWRNRVHDSGFVDTVSKEIEFQEGIRLFNQILDFARPLFRYKLFAVDSIMNIDFQDRSKVQYFITWLIGNYFLPESGIISLNENLPQKLVYILDENNNTVLTMDPFLEYSLCLITNAREIYSFNKLHKETIEFTTFRFSSILTKDKSMLPWLEST